mgnify:CR=1 FL=1
MKYLILILALLLVLPPAQAGPCGTAQGQVSSEAVESGHDCCPGDEAEKADEAPACEGQAHCGACIAGCAAIAATSTGISSWPRDYTCYLSAANLSPSHDTPPFRPPIS